MLIRLDGKVGGIQCIRITSHPFLRFYVAFRSSDVGDPAFVWQHVRYQFAASGIYSGRYGLWRRIRGRANTDSVKEELIAPFASTARFSYFTNPSAYNDTSVKTAPSNLNQIRGFQIYLPAESSDTVPGHTAPQRANTTTSVFFKNTRVQ